VFNGVKDDARSAGAKEDGSDHHVQAIKTTGRKKTRNRVGAAFDEDTAESEFRETREDIGRSNNSIRRWKREHLDAGQSTRRSPCCYHQPSSTITVEQACRRRQASARIEHNASRMRTVDAADRKLRIISKSGSYSDDDGVNDCAEAVQMRETRRSIDVVGIAAYGCDAPIERLSDLTDDNEFVDAAHAQRSEGLLPWRGQRVGRCSEQRGHNPPGLAQIDSAAHNFLQLQICSRPRKKMKIQGGFNNYYASLTQLNSAKFRQHNSVA
jgi:hypothetical protein